MFTYIAFVGTLSTGVVNSFTRRNSMHQVAQFILLAPIVATAQASALFGEKILPIHAVSTTLILSGIYLTIRCSNNKII